MWSAFRVPIVALAFLAAQAIAFEPPQVVEVPRPAPAKWQEFRAEPGKVVRLALKDGAPAVWVLAEEGSSAELTPQDTAVPSVDFVGARGRHCLIAYAAGQQPARIVVIVGDGGTDPGPGPGPVDPPPPGPATYYFAVVRSDGPADPAFTKTMSLPEWKTLTQSGHSVKDFTLRDALKLNLLTAGTPLPCVVTLRVNAGGKTSVIVRAPVPLPTTGQGILDLPKGVSP